MLPPPPVPELELLLLPQPAAVIASARSPTTPAAARASFTFLIISPLSTEEVEMNSYSMSPPLVKGLPASTRAACVASCDSTSSPTLPSRSSASRGPPHSEAVDALVPDLRLDRLAGLVQVLRHLRKPERLPAEVGGDDRLRDEADLLAVDPERRAAGFVTAALERDTREAKPRPVLVSGECVA